MQSPYVLWYVTPPHKTFGSDSRPYKTFGPGAVASGGARRATPSPPTRPSALVKPPNLRAARLSLAFETYRIDHGTIPGEIPAVVT